MRLRARKRDKHIEKEMDGEIGKGEGGGVITTKDQNDTQCLLMRKWVTVVTIHQACACTSLYHAIVYFSCIPIAEIFADSIYGL